MKAREQIVIERLQQILDETGLKKTDLAKIADVKPQAVNNWFKNGKVSVNSASAISNYLSDRYNTDKYKTDWLLGGNNISISNSKINNSPISNNITNSPHYGALDNNVPLVQGEPDDEHYHCLEHLDVRAAAGLVEYSNDDYPEIIKSIWLSNDGLLELVGRRSVNGLSIINVPTDSMEPTIPKGSPVIIDTKVNGYIGDGIYAYSVGGALFIKRIQKLMKGGYKIISDNKERYETEEIDDEYLDNAVFIGKFLKVWKIKVEEL